MTYKTHRTGANSEHMQSPQPRALLRNVNIVTINTTSADDTSRIVTQKREQADDAIAVRRRNEATLKYIESYKSVVIDRR